MKLAHASDADRIFAILQSAPHLAMFPLSYLAKDGFAGSEARKISFWLKEGDVPEVLAVTNVGIAMPFLPGGSLPGAKAALSGLPLSGMIGPHDQVRGLLHLMGLDDAPAILDVDEPHFLLSLDKLIIPEGSGTLVPLDQAPKSTVLDWMEAYQLEALNTPNAVARERAETGYANGLEQDNRRVLMSGDVPLAMTAFNAQLPDIVQIGGVYTPPELRGQGYGRRIVALHLAEARERGVTQATLSAANESAARAYKGIGFQQVGRWSFVLFDGPQDHG